MASFPNFPARPGRSGRLAHRLAGPLAGGLLLLLAAIPAATAEPRERLLFNSDWRFLKTDDPNWTAAQLDYAVLRPWLLATSATLLRLRDAGLPPALPSALPIDQAKVGFDDQAWLRLDLPHDWGIGGPFRQDYPGETGKLPWWGVAWYRKTFPLPATAAGQSFRLEIDGAMAFASVWVNGRLAGGWAYGYASFSVDLTPHLRFGADNVIAIRLDNPPNSSRWYPGGGLYRNVWLVRTGPVQVAPWGTFVTTPRVSAEEAVVTVTTAIDNTTAETADLAVTTELFRADAQGRPTGARLAGGPPLSRRIGAGQQITTAQSFTLASPALWGLAQPQRHVAVTTIRAGEAVLDRQETLFGIRSAVFDTQRGFLLNGERVPLRGVCLHHDLGALGAAVNRRALERRLLQLREMGCNAIRTAHNPPAPELLDLCDELGFVVMDEVFDCWSRGKTRHDYHQVFADWHERDLRAFIRRDRNHPSVVLWSIGNEIHEQHDAEGWRTGAALAKIVREEDPTRPLTAGLDGIESPYRGLQSVLDVIGYNYKPGEYARFHAAFPAIPVLGSETASTISSRGEYFFPVPDDPRDRRSRVDFHVSSYDQAAEAWATTPETEWAGQAAGEFVAGEFVWTGFDYLGEPSPYLKDAEDRLLFRDPARQARADEELRQTGRITVPSRSSYFGLIDLAGFPKDRYYLYQARWRPDLPMAHLLPHWTWPGREGEVTPVHVYTTGDEAELWLNGRSLGRKRKGANDSRLRWDDVRYAPGELRVVAYRAGQTWAEATVRTAGAAARIGLETDRTEVAADGRELVFVTLAIRDAAGTLVPRADSLLRFTVDGPATIAAVDNGDPTSHEPFQATRVRAYNGRALLILRPKTGEPGTIAVRVESDGLPPATLQLRTL